MIDKFKMILAQAVKAKASDVHISAGGPFRMRNGGTVGPVEDSPTLGPRDTAAIAAEIMRHTATIEECIADPEKTAEITDLIAGGRTQYGMQTFDQHLTALYAQRLISLEVAKSAATSSTDFERNLQFQ